MVAAAVAVTVGVDSPMLLLETGSIDRGAVYHSQPAPHILQFRYTVQVQDVTSDLQYAHAAALTLGVVAPFATIKRQSSTPTTDAVLTLAANGVFGGLMFNKALVIESAPAKVVAVTAEVAAMGRAAGPGKAHTRRSGECSQ